ncbi:MAG: tRNA adenosine(34) deaminase TadA [Wenzhouxiangella sp.]
MSSDSHWMRLALDQAAEAERLGEVPIGEVLVVDDELLGSGFNRVITDSDPSAHAEMVALRAAARQQGNYRLPGTTLYVTLEPCSMCAGAIINARIQRVVYAADDPKAGAHLSVFEVLDNPRLNHRCQVTAGVLAEEASEMLRAFFRTCRARRQVLPEK